MIGAVASGCTPIDSHPCHNDHRYAPAVLLVTGHSKRSNGGHDDYETNKNRKVLPPSQRIGNAGATWLSTAAISTLTLSTTGTNFLNGSIATCYLML